MEEGLFVVLGAAISIVGTLTITRRQTRRDQRIRIYDELLPPLLNRDPKGLLHWSRIAPIMRAATIAGKRDRELAIATKDSFALLVQRDIQHEFEPDIGWIPVSGLRGSWSDSFSEAEKATEAAISAFSEHLMKRIL